MTDKVTTLPTKKTPNCYPRRPVGLGMFLGRPGGTPTLQGKVDIQPKIKPMGLRMGFYTAS